jgi:uncharacterized protein YbjQ (UPF0145 family)
MAILCAKCKREQTNQAAKYCEFCDSSTFVDSEAVHVDDEVTDAMLKKAHAVECFTTDSVPGRSVSKSLGIAFGNSSKQAFWGLSTQANRLSRAYDAALLNLQYDAALKGANAVIGIQFALNNSTGSGTTWIAGSSEAVMLLGTAVVLDKN